MNGCEAILNSPINCQNWRLTPIFKINLPVYALILCISCEVCIKILLRWFRNYIVKERYNIYTSVNRRYMKSCASWYKTSWNPMKVDRRFVRIYLLCFLGRRVSQTRNQQEAGNTHRLRSIQGYLFLYLFTFKLGSTGSNPLGGTDVHFCLQ
jgi:hypothetical protein